MTALADPAPAPALAGRLAGRVRDVAVLTTRNFVHIRREPLRLSDVTIQPVLFTLLFVYVFGSGVKLPGGGSYTDFAIAGLLAPRHGRDRPLPLARHVAGGGARRTHPR
jgi:ABC-2 type transport system permease protein